MSKYVEPREVPYWRPKGDEAMRVCDLATVCVLSTEGHWLVTEASLRSQGKSTPFSGYELPGRVLATVVGGHVAFEA